MKSIYLKRTLGILFLASACGWYAFVIVWLCGAKSKETTPNLDFITLSCIEANPYKSRYECMSGVEQINMILTKEKT